MKTEQHQHNLLEQQKKPKKKPKKKYQSKAKGYTEDSDLIWYTSDQDADEALNLTNARFTLESDSYSVYY